MRNVSIITLVTLFFALTMVVINIALGLEYKRQRTDGDYFAFQRFIMSVKMMHNAPFEEMPKEWISLHVNVSKMDKNTIAQNGEKVLEDPFFDMMRYQNKLYFVPKTMPSPPPFPPPHTFEEERPHKMRPPLPMMFLLEDTSEVSMVRLWVLTCVINLFLLLFFGVVMQKLLRLRHLKVAIRAFGENPQLQTIQVESKDELGEIATEFNHAMSKIHRLKGARTLFLRNILHELKTPIMKGQILSHSLENQSKKEQLERIFKRLESLLEEMVKVEKLSSNEWSVDAKEYRLVDVLGHALDLLMSETNRLHVKIEEEAPLLNVDFELFATALKNLLDNALKYSHHDVDVSISAKAICVWSDGEKLDEKRLDFTKAFNRSIEGSTQGLGLGLYIAHEVVKKHGFRLTYAHEDGRNCFSIFFR